MTDINLLPKPRVTQITGGTFTLVDRLLILIDTPNVQETLFTAKRWQDALSKYTNLRWDITTSKTVPAQQIGIILRLDRNGFPYRQGYKLDIRPDLIQVTSGDNPGLFYGICTLVQLLYLSSSERNLFCLHIWDYPDFPSRGVMLDISRDKVPTLDTVLSLVDRLASWKINQLQLYTEHTFAYRNHPDVWAMASPFTGEEILILDAYCQQRYIELVPNQNSFGHMHRWLKFPKYRPLAECPDGYEDPWGGHSDEPFSLCPSDLGSIQFIRELYDEILPHFSSNLFNVGCDETWDIGHGRSRHECDIKGVGRVYLDFLLKIASEVRARGRRMQFWGDIILQHPEYVNELPKDVIALEWGYDADQPFDAHCEKFAAAGLDFYVCPGTSSWNSIAGRTDNAIANLCAAAVNGLKYGAIGYLNTDWGDSGHWQPLPASYLGFLVGAAFSWNIEANRQLDIPQALSQHAFDDPTGNMGKVAYELGNAYQVCGVEPGNASALFVALHSSLQLIKNNQEKISSPAIKHTLEFIESALSPLPNSKCMALDKDLIKREIQFMAVTLKHACDRILYSYGEENKTSASLASDIDFIMQEHELIWLARNRPGGLEDSLARFARIKKDYVG